MRNFSAATILFCMYLCFFCSCSLRRDKASNISMYRITKIDSISNAYFIYAQKNDSMFKIVSIKDSIHSCKNVFVGNYYMFRLTSWHSTRQNKLANVDGIYNGGEIIGYYNEDIVQDLFFAQNLKGLCHTK